MLRELAMGLLSLEKWLGVDSEVERWHQELGILVSRGCSTQATSGNQRKPGNLDISKLMSDFPETYTAIGCQGAMETETYEN